MLTACKTNWKLQPHLTSLVGRACYVSSAAVGVLGWWMEQEAELVAVRTLWPWPWKRKRKLRYLTWYPYTAAHYGRAPVCKVQSSTLAGWQRLAWHCWADNKTRGPPPPPSKNTPSAVSPSPCYRPADAAQSRGQMQNYRPASKCSFSKDPSLIFCPAKISRNADTTDTTQTWAT